jgi:hypothetical protein
VRRNKIDARLLTAAADISYQSVNYTHGDYTKFTYSDGTVRYEIDLRRNVGDEGGDVGAGERGGMEFVLDCRRLRGSSLELSHRPAKVG